MEQKTKVRDLYATKCQPVVREAEKLSVPNRIET